MAGLFQVFSEKYQYFAEPEGKDPLGKIFGLAKYGFITSSFLTIYDGCLISKCANVYQFLNTAGFYFVPITSMCLSYSSITFALTNLRGKDDVWNSVIGALSAGGVLQSWQKKPIFTAPATALLVLYAVLKKDYEKNKHKYSVKGLIIRQESTPPKWLFPVRNNDYRYLFNGASYKHDRESYWRNFNTNTN